MFLLLGCILFAVASFQLPGNDSAAAYASLLIAEALAQSTASAGLWTETGAGTIASIAHLGAIHPALIAVFQTLASLMALAAFSAPRKRA
jgi:hypothetical protein